jgi:predicted phage terminase large subunit-like protein
MTKKEELKKQFPDVKPKSVTFIPSTVYDNKILLQNDPGYIANLQAMSLVDRERLLGDAQRGGNWKIKPEAGKLFNRAWFPVITDWDKNRAWSAVIRWDFAATEQSLTSQDPDYTAWCVMVRDRNGEEIVLEAGQKRLKPTDVYAEFTERCRYWWDYFRALGIGLMVRWEIEPGSASTREARYLAGLVPFADAHGIRSVGNKIVRAKPLASQAEHGFVSVLKGAWNDEWLNHMHSQPAEHDDMMDAASGAHDDLIREGTRKKARSYGG